MILKTANVPRPNPHENSKGAFMMFKITFEAANTENAATM